MFVRGEKLAKDENNLESDRYTVGILYETNDHWEVFWNFTGHGGGGISKIAAARRLGKCERESALHMSS